MHPLLEAFDSRLLRYAFAYGSSVMRQAGYTDKQKSSGMLDLMLVVKGEPVEIFHPSNIARNRTHYSSLMASNFGQKYLLGPIQHSGAGVYFNTDVMLPCGQRAKYGMVGEDRFLSDLQNWDSLYLAGRLHKPVEDLIQPDEHVLEAKKTNLTFALHSALLLLPEQFTRGELLETLVGLSYLGDIRRGLAENPKKVRNIVEGQGDLLWSLYEPLLGEVGFGEFVLDTGSSLDSFNQDNAGDCRYLRMLCLPPSIRRRVGWPKDFLIRPSHIRSAIWRISCWPSIVQSAKGLICANPSVSMRYLFSKLSKRFS